MIRKNPLTRKVLQVSPADLIYFEICYSRPKTKATRIFLCAQKAILEVKIPSENGGGGVNSADCLSTADPPMFYPVLYLYYNSIKSRRDYAFLRKIKITRGN